MAGHNPFGELGRKLDRLLHSARYDRELEEEMRVHLEMKMEAEGDSLAARRRFGSSSYWREASRETWGWKWLEQTIQDLRYAARQMAHNPGFTAVALLSLGLGTGANTAIFAAIDGLLLRTLPASHPEQLIAIRGRRSYPAFEEIRDQNHVFSETIATHFMPHVEASVDGGAPAQITGELVSGNYFPALGVNPRIGRALTPNDDRAADGSPVAVISYRYWQRAFGGSPDAIGRRIRVRTAELDGGTSGMDIYSGEVAPEGALLTVIGVAPPGFQGVTAGLAADLWTPITMQPAVMPGRAFLTQPHAVWVDIIGRIKPGLTFESARASLTATLRRRAIEEDGPAMTPELQRELAEIPANIERGDKGFGRIRRPLEQPQLILFGVVGLVLLIACLNVANLLLARASARQREIAVRLSVGAGRARLIRQLLAESALLGLAGGAAGLLFSFAGARGLDALLGRLDAPIDLPFQADWRTLGFTAAISLLTALLFGAAPALRATRVSLSDAMKESGRGSPSGRNRTVSGLVAAQVAISAVLLISAALFLRTLHNLESQDVGYNPSRLWILRADPISAGYRGEQVGRSMEALLDRIRALPGVRAATFSENGLFSGAESATPVVTDSVHPAAGADHMPHFDQIGPNYFTVTGIPILLGRDLTARDDAASPQVTIINETMAKFYFPGVNPIGHHLRSTDADDKFDLEIVGVVRDAVDHSFRTAPVSRFYVPYLHPIDAIETANFEIRAAASPGNLADALRKEVASFNRSLAIISIKEVRELMDQSVVEERTVATLSSAFGILALILAAVGLYGVMSYAVARRTSEIGIRMALGAGVSKVVAMVLREGAAVVFVGALAGVLAAYALARLVHGFLFGLSDLDPLSFGAAAVLLLIVAAAAGYVPARRAARIDPLRALRYE